MFFLVNQNGRSLAARLSSIAKFLRESEAATAAEYAFMLVLIIVAVIASVNAVGNSTAQGWNNNATVIGNALNGSGS